MKNKLVIYGARKLALVCFGQNRVKIIIKMIKMTSTLICFKPVKVFLVCVEFWLYP